MIHVIAEYRSQCIFIIIFISYPVVQYTLIREHLECIQPMKRQVILRHFIYLSVSRIIRHTKHDQELLELFPITDRNGILEHIEERLWRPVSNRGIA